MFNNFNLITIINIIIVFLLINILLQKQNRNYISSIIDNLFNNKKDDLSTYMYIHIPNDFWVLNEDILKYYLGLFIEYVCDHYNPNHIYSINIIFYQLNPKTGEYNRISDKCVFNIKVNDPLSVDELYSLITWYEKEFHQKNYFFIIFKIN